MAAAPAAAAPLRQGRLSLCLAAAAVAACALPAQARLTALHAGCQAWDRPGRKLCEDPVRRAPVNFPKHLLLGKSIKSKMFSGYVNVTSEDFLFYLFAEADERVAKDAPLIVFSGGGPGCSAMEGAVIETGPYVLFDVKAGSSMFPMRLSTNAFSWHRLAHVLYVDQPRYVGFSYGSGRALETSAEAGLDMVQFLLGWRQLYPEHSRRKLIFASESYGSHLVAGWADAVLSFNKHSSEPLEMRGIVVGNGLIDDSIQGLGSLLEYQRREKLMPEGVKPEAWGGAQVTMMKHLGYAPNVYDFRLQNQECCGCTGYNYKVWSDWLMRQAVTSALNVCPGAGQEAFQGCQAGCVDLGAFDKKDGHSVRTPQILARVLQEGVPVILYYGMQDTAANYVGGLAAALSLEWPGSKAFADAPLEDFRISGAVAGQQKYASGLTWMQVRAAGHMVALDGPLVVLEALGVAVRQARQEPSKGQTQQQDEAFDEDHATFARFT